MRVCHFEKFSSSASYLGRGHDTRNSKLEGCVYKEKYSLFARFDTRLPASIIHLCRSFIQEYKILYSHKIIKIKYK